MTLDHLSRGRFVLGLGSGELENTVPYGFDFQKPVARFEEALNVIKLLWEQRRTGRLRRAVLSPGACAAGYRAVRREVSADLDRRGRTADAARSPAATPTAGGPTGAYTPEDYAAKLTVVRDAAERAGRDPMAIVPAVTQICLIGDDDEVAAMLDAPLVKASSCC